MPSSGRLEKNRRLIDMAESTAGGVMTCARIGRPL